VATVAEQYMERGAAKGRAEATRALLLRQLAVRFGPLGEDVKARVAAADIATVEGWAERFVTASTLAEVFGEG
jgi:hypothetical protein